MRNDIPCGFQWRRYLGVDRVAVRPWDRDQIPPRETSVETCFRRDLPPLDAIGRADTFLERSCRTPEKDREENAAVAGEHALEVFEKWQVLGVRIA